MKIATAAGVLGEKIQTDSIFNSLVNDQGIAGINRNDTIALLTSFRKTRITKEWSEKYWFL